MFNKPDLKLNNFNCTVYVLITLHNYHFSLCDEFTGIELSNYGLQDFVGDGGQHAIVVIQAQGGENLGQRVRPEQQQLNWTRNYVVGRIVTVGLLLGSQDKYYN